MRRRFKMLIRYCLCDQSKRNERAGNAEWKSEDKNACKVVWENMKERDRLEDLNINERIILKCSLRK